MIRRPALVLALLSGLNLLNYVDRFVLSAVLPRIETTFAIKHEAAGFLSTICLLGYFLTSPAFGALADRGKRTSLIAGGVLVWSLATVASGLATGVVSLGVARAFVGVGEASYAALAPTLLDDVAPPGQKRRYLSVFFAMIPVGAAAGYLVGGVLEKHFGWHATFFWAGAPGIVLALTCLWIEEPARRLVSAGEPILQSLLPLWRSHPYRKAVLGYSAFTFAVGALGFWAPTFLVRRFSMDLVAANMAAGGATVIGGAGGTALGGIWADFRARRRVNATPAEQSNDQLWVCAMGSAIAAPIALLSLLSPNAHLCVALFFLCELALFIPTSPVNAVILESVPVEIRASAMALSIFAIHLFGDLWSPPFLGALADRMPIQWAMTVIPIGIAVSAYVWWPQKT